MSKIIVPDTEQEETPITRVIRTVRDYIANDLGKVSEMKATDPEAAKAANEPETIYQGFTVIGVQAQGRLLQIPVEFFLEASNIEEAFEGFKAAAERQLHVQMDEARKQSVQQQLNENAAIGKQIAGSGMKLVTD